MPFYEYECSSCKFYTELLQKVSDPSLRKCPSCGRSTMKKLMSAPNFRLKGGGWYETDFKSDKENKRNLASRRKRRPKDASAKPEAAKPEAAKAADAKASESKPAEAKPAERSRPSRRRLHPAQPNPRRPARAPVREDPRRAPHARPSQIQIEAGAAFAPMTAAQA